MTLGSFRKVLAPLPNVTLFHMSCGDPNRFGSSEIGFMAYPEEKKVIFSAIAGSCVTKGYFLCSMSPYADDFEVLIDDRWYLDAKDPLVRVEVAESGRDILLLSAR